MPRPKPLPILAYFELSKRPLQILLFVAPMMLVFELATWSHARRLSEPFLTVDAYQRFSEFFSQFGVSGLYMAGALIVLILLVWHLVTRDPWEVHLGVPIIMLCESIVLAVPLLVLDQLIGRLVPLAFPEYAGWGALTAAVEGPIQLHELPWQTRLLLSLGAGIYEELLFRFLLILTLHMVLVDLLRVPRTLGGVLCIATSAVLFTLYHDLHLPDGTLDLHRVAFFGAAGVYFAAVYLIRGFGVVVGTHAMYDVFVVVIVPALGGGG